MAHELPKFSSNQFSYILSINMHGSLGIKITSFTCLTLVYMMISFQDDAYMMNRDWGLGNAIVINNITEIAESQSDCDVLKLTYKDMGFDLHCYKDCSVHVCNIYTVCHF